MFSKRIKYTPEEFIERILCTVPGMTHKGNVFLMEKAVVELQSELPVLEIGSFCGQSAIILSYLLQKHKKKNKIICVDPFLYEGWNDVNTKNVHYLKSVGGNAEIKRPAYLDFVKKSFSANTSFFLGERQPELYEMTSDEFFKRAGKDQIFSFAYIDGGHAFEQARRDVENVLARLESNSFFLLDDSEKGSSLGSAKLAEKLKGDKRVLLSGENPHCLFRVR